MQQTSMQENREENKGRPGSKHKAEELMQSLSSAIWLLLRLNIMFLMFCIPVITVFASVSAMTNVLMKHVRKDDFHVWNDFWKEFKSSFFKSTAAGLIIGAAAAVVFFMGHFVYISFGGFAGSLGAAFMMVFGILLFFSACYLFPVISTVDLSLGQCLRNSFLLALIEIKRNALLLMPLALLASCILLYPVTVPLLVFIVFSLCQFVICYTVSGVIQKRIIDPYYKKKEISDKESPAIKNS